MATFLGYTTDELDCEGSEHRQIEHFLSIFRMPDCGARNTRFLHEALQLAGAQSPATYSTYVLALFCFRAMNYNHSLYHYINARIAHGVRKASTRSQLHAVKKPETQPPVEKAKVLCLFFVYLPEHLLQKQTLA